MSILSKTSQGGGGVTDHGLLTGLTGDDHPQYHTQLRAQTWGDSRYAPIGNAVPAGAVFWFASASPPSGFLSCNGAAVSRSTYASLFAAVGTAFGAGNGSTTFNLPDLRDDFIRGAGATRSVGQRESWAIENITGALDMRYIRATASMLLGSTGALSYSNVGTASMAVYGTSGDSATSKNVISFDASAVAQTAAETRPRNLALLPCIKF